MLDKLSVTAIGRTAMPVIDPTLTLAELVTADLGAAAVLDRPGLDYCCGGHRSLADVARDAGTPVDEVVAALASAPAGAAPGWTELGPAELVDHIVSVHHAYLDEALPRLDALATKVTGVHGDRHPELRQVRRLVAELHAELAPHMRREEQVLFPAIRALTGAGSGPRLPRATLRTAIGVMEGEHDHTGELLATLRSSAG